MIRRSARREALEVGLISHLVGERRSAPRPDWTAHPIASVQEPQVLLSQSSTRKVHPYDPTPEQASIHLGLPLDDHIPWGTVR